MRSKLKRGQSNPDRSDDTGEDIDSKLAELLGDSADLDFEATDHDADDLIDGGSDVDADDDGAHGADDEAAAESDDDDAARAGAEQLSVGADAPPTAPAKPSRRSKSQARLERRVDDAVRSIVNLHEFKTAAPMYTTIAVVSALPGEGVTTVANGLARVLAEDFDTAVCIVDTNPSSDGAGIYELLTEDTDLDAVLHDEGNGVFRLRLGQMPPGARNSIFRSAKWTDLVRDLTIEFDHCVFDTPPMLGRGNTLTVLQHVEAHVLVARYGSTASAQVKAVANELGSQPRLGSVLNGFKSKTPAVIRRFFSE